MSKKFNDETLKLVWEMITKDRTPIHKVALALNAEKEVINKIYEAAKRKFGDDDRHTIVIKQEAAINKPAFKRPPAEYSNRSPYGIARAGISK